MKVTFLLGLPVAARILGQSPGQSHRLTPRIVTPLRRGQGFEAARSIPVGVPTPA